MSEGEGEGEGEGESDGESENANDGMEAPEEAEEGSAKMAPADDNEGTEGQRLLLKAPSINCH